MQVPSRSFPNLLTGLSRFSDDETNTINSRVFRAHNGGDYVGADPIAIWTMKSKVDPGPNSLDRFEVRFGDCPPDDVGRNVERCEWSGHQTVDGAKFPVGTIIWVSYSMLIPTSNPFSQFTIVGQLHSTLGPSDTVDIVPLYVEFTPSKTIRFKCCYTIEDPCTHEVPGNLVGTYSNFRIGYWTNFVHQIQCVPDGTGTWNVWINGIQELGFSGPLGQLTSDGDYWKFGQYRGTSSESSVVWYSNFEIGTVDLSSRITSPLPLPTGVPW